MRGTFQILIYPATLLFSRHPWIACATVPPLLLAWLYFRHQYGPHNDIPFRQYLRFQARVQAKRIKTSATFVASQLKGLARLGGVLHKHFRRCTLRQLGVLVLVLVFWALAIHVGFGAVYVILVAFAAVFCNLGQRGQGEASAYSVFNNFQYLQGELRMDQVEAEMRGGGHLPRLPRRAEEDAAAQMGAQGVERFGDGDADDIQVLPLQRNDKVVLENGKGLSKTVKGKVLQEYLDRGWFQVCLPGFLSLVCSPTCPCGCVSLPAPLFLLLPLPLSPP